MLKQYHQTVGALFRIADACVIAAVWLASYWLRFNLPLVEVTKGFPPLARYASLTPLVVLLWMIVLNSMGAYRSHRMLRRTHEAHLVIRSHFVAMLVFIAMTYLFSEYKYSRGVMIYFGVLGGVLLVSFRLVVRNLLRSVRRRGLNIRHVLIVGDGSAAQTLIARVNRFPELGLKPVGYLSQKDSNAGEIAGVKRLGEYSQLLEIIRSSRADQVLIALPRKSYDQLDRLLGELKDETIDIQIIPDIHEFVTLGCEVEDFDGLPIVNLNDSPLSGWGATAKRITDILLSGTALLILSPLLLAIAILVKLTSRGPVMYSQERMGLDGRTFKMYKFRSMRTDAEQGGAVWAKEGDDRRTPIGAFLRATSLDELPQFWNVFLGDMSLVGPRPERPVFVAQFKGEIPHYMLRHKVKAGITGWAQVNGWRGNTSLERRIECDLYYIRNWSYGLDVKILLLTLYKGFINKNAY